MGLRLLVDADVQPSLSKFFPLATPQPSAGLTEVIVRGEVTAACITATVFPNLDIEVSDDDPEGPTAELAAQSHRPRLPPALRAADRSGGGRV
jgi:chromosome partitioning related protein ParA